MKLAQPGILQEETTLARFMMFSMTSSVELPMLLEELNNVIETEHTVIGLGQSLVAAMGKEIPGLKTMPAQNGVGVDVPSTPYAMWFWLRGSDRGEIYHRSRLLESLLSPAFVLDEVLDSFQYDQNRDLTGYEDGTENPKGEEATKAAIIQGQGKGLDGSSFVAIQQWLHDFETFDGMATEQQDDAIGRHVDTNEEFDDAPESAHVKRTAQESFDPEAFILRRSMPWVDGMHSGLNFVAFGSSFDAFEAQLHRMLGHEDGIVDGIFEFTKPISGAYFWCPPVKDEKLDLSLLGL